MGMVPRLRFQGFKGEWEMIRLGKLLEFKNGINATKEQYGTGYKFINVLDILNNEFITYDKIIGSVNVTESLVNKFPVDYGDILFQRSSETREEVGTANVYLDPKKIATFGGFVIRGRKIGEYDPVFLNKLLKTDLARNQITSKSGGSTRYNVGQEILSSVTVLLPNLAEQNKIAIFLTSVDDKIKQLNQKKLLLGRYKKVLMQRLFKDYDEKKYEAKIFEDHLVNQSSRLRFTDENGNNFPNWENKKLSTVTEIYDGTHQTPKYLSKGIPFYSVEHITANQFTNTKFISEDVYHEENKRVKLEKGDILMTRIGSIGVAKYLDWDVKASFYVSLALIKQSKEIHNSFLCHFINTKFFQNELWKRTIHVAFPQKINLGEIGECEIAIPTKKEQTKIVSFLSAIDSKIENVGNQIKQTQDFKMGLLQQLFV